MAPLQTPEQRAKAESAAQQLGLGTVEKGKQYLSNLPVSTLSATQPTWPQQSTAQNDTSFNSILSGAKNYYAGAQAAEQAANQPVNAAEARLKTLMGVNATRGTATLGMEQDAKLDQQQSRLNDLSTAITNRTTALEQAKLSDQYDIMNQEGRGGVPQQIVRGQQARMERDRAYQRQADATELGGMVATAELMRGNIQTARDTIDRTIALKYGDIEQSINNEIFFYEKNWDRLTAAQQKSAQARVEMLNAQRDSVNAAKQDETTRFNLQAAAAQAGADGATIEAIKNAPDLAGAATIANRYIGGQSAIDRDLNRQSKRQDMALRSLQIKGQEKALNEGDDTFTFAKAQRAALAAALPNDGINKLQSDIRTHGAQKALEMGDYSEDVYAAVGAMFGIPGPDNTPSEENLTSMFNDLSGVSIPTKEQAYQYTNNNPDYDPYGFWSGPQTGRYIAEQEKKRDDFSSAYQARYQALRSAGMSHEEVLKQLLK